MSNSTSAPKAAAAIAPRTLESVPTPTNPPKKSVGIAGQHDAIQKGKLPPLEDLLRLPSTYARPGTREPTVKEARGFELQRPRRWSPGQGRKVNPEPSPTRDTPSQRSKEKLKDLKKPVRFHSEDGSTRGSVGLDKIQGKTGVVLEVEKKSENQSFKAGIGGNHRRVGFEIKIEF